MHIAHLQQFMAALFRRAHLTPRHALLVATAIADAEARGIPSHGVRRLPNYLTRLAAGAITARPQLRWVRQQRATALLDADHGMGHIAAHYAVQRLIRTTRRYGIASVGIIRNEHLGALDHSIQTIVAAQLVGIMLVNTPAAMAPLGGTTALIGSNPLAIGIPGAQQPLLVFDGATTAVARGKISAAAERNQPIPSHWALDVHGQPTSDPQAALAGALLPAGTLGYGLGLAIALLTGGLLGGVSDDQLPSFLNPPHQSVPTSVLLIGIDPDALGGLAHLHKHGQAFIDRIGASRGNPRIPGQRRNVPATSITLAANTLSTLTSLADTYRLPTRYRLPTEE